MGNKLGKFFSHLLSLNVHHFPAPYVHLGAFSSARTRLQYMYTQAHFMQPSSAALRANISCSRSTPLFFRTLTRFCGSDCRKGSGQTNEVNHGAHRSVFARPSHSISLCNMGNNYIMRTRPQGKCVLQKRKKESIYTYMYVSAVVVGMSDRYKLFSRYGTYGKWV